MALRTRLISARGQIVRGEILHKSRLSWGAFGVGNNLFTTAGPLTDSLGLSLATYCGIIDDGMMTATLAAPRDPMIRFLDR